MLKTGPPEGKRAKDSGRIRSTQATATQIKQAVLQPEVFDLPEGVDRVETGPIQFEDDWTGLFIRGDEALHYGMVIRDALERLESGTPWASTAELVALQALLMSVAEK